MERSVPPIYLSYLICATPRTGSNFLCELLRAIRVAGRPDDYFWNPPFWRQRWGVTGFPPYFERILREGTTRNGVFGVKMMWDYLDTLLPQLATLSGLTDVNPPEIFATAFPNPRYLRLIRRDKVRQGISFYRALETDLWRSTDSNKVGAAEPAFDFSAIDRLVQLSVREDQAWHEYFQRYGMRPFTIAYEDLAAAPEDVVLSILEHLGIPLPDGLPPLRWAHQKQADGLTEAWVQQYLALKEGDPT